MKLRRSARQAMKLLTKRFPLLSNIQLNPGKVDVLAPRHVQLQQVGLLRHLTQHDGLQNTDPEFNILEQSLNAGFSGYEEVDFEALEDLDNNRAAPGTAPMDEHMQEVDNDTGGTQTDSSEDWTPNAKSKKAPTRKRKRAPAMNASKSSKRSRSKRVGSTETANATSAPPFPTVFYKKSLPPQTLPEKFHALRPPNLSSSEWKTERKRQYNIWWQGQKHASSVEVHTVQDGFDIPQHSRISKPAWMGLRASADVRSSILEAIAGHGSNAAHTILEGITRIPYMAHLAVAVCDLNNRMFLYRSQLTPNILDCILPKVNAAIPNFVRSITRGFSEDDMQNNSRGDHWFSIAGHDRNNRQRPEATKFQKNNHLAIARAFSPGQIFHTLTPAQKLWLQYPASSISRHSTMLSGLGGLHEGKVWD
ncbi:hypothetical protein EV359DRAFT_69113 [Lentinula novae-zelandiae]|nr:hypothetical protein EV359DRAFT_69113 [Lentinula novae-zelandiae]